ncbi:hypothetical protein ACFOHS_03500 [Jhaorihella thermophila]
MKADPMMPKAVSIPCICRVLTKASSVVIFMCGHSHDAQLFGPADKGQALFRV